MTHDLPPKLAELQAHIDAGDHVHLYGGDAVKDMAEEIFGKDEYHLDVMPSNVDHIGDDMLILTSSQGTIKIFEEDILGIHLPSEP